MEATEGFNQLVLMILVIVCKENFANMNSLQCTAEQEQKVLVL
jgi:hypothetical protein